MHHYAKHADVRSIERAILNRRPALIRGVLLAVTIGASLAWLLVEGLAR